MRVISPADVEPTPPDTNLPSHFASLSSHRRVLSVASGGPAGLDVGYNQYKVGLGGRGAYAYTKDEYCYTAEGRIDTESSGIAIVNTPGMFMWRPIGAQTNALEVKEDALTICAFTPARIDDWSHKIPPSEIEPWDGNEATRNVPIHRHYREVAPTPYPGAPDDERVVYRVIFSEENGSDLMHVSHVTVLRGVTLGAIGNERDNLWWIESGAIEVDVNGETLHAKAGDFLFRAAGDKFDQLRVIADSVIISYAAVPPA